MVCVQLTRFLAGSSCQTAPPPPPTAHRNLGRAGRKEPGRRPELRPLPSCQPSGPPSPACTTAVRANQVRSFRHALPPTESPNQISPPQRPCQESRGQDPSGDSHVSSIPTVFPLLTPFQRSASSSQLPPLEDKWVAGPAAEDARTQPHLPVF